MGHRYAKGSKRPDRKEHHRDRGAGIAKDHWTLGGGVPWPTLGDGTDWTDEVKRVRHHELTEEEGALQWVEWTHPDGSYMRDREKVRRATKTLPERREMLPGRWYAVVAWDSRDTFDFGLMARHPLDHLLPA